MKTSLYTDTSEELQAIIH